MNVAIVGGTGNMGRFHDMETLLTAAKNLQTCADIEFLFIGEGHKKKFLRELASSWELKNCQFHPYVDAKDLGYSLMCANVGLVSLSDGQEGLSVPSKTYSLMAAGVPIIAVMSPETEVAMIVREEKCSHVINSGDVKGLEEAIICLYSNTTVAEKMGENGRRAIRTKYNLHRAAKSYMALLEGINKWK